LYFLIVLAGKKPVDPLTSDQRVEPEASVRTDPGCRSSAELRHLRSHPRSGIAQRCQLQVGPYQVTIIYIDLRAILNFTPGPQGRTSPLGVNLALRGEICPLGGMFTPSFTPRGKHYLLFRRMEGQTEFHPQGTKFTPGGQLRPWGLSLAQGVKLRLGL
jgi:hypothetical protein